MTGFEIRQDEQAEMPGAPLSTRAFRRVFINSPTSQQCSDCGARHIGLCDALPDPDLQVLAQAAQRINVSAGKVFIEEGSAAKHFYSITQGDVLVYKSLADGRRQITGFMGVGHFLGITPAGHYSFSAEAMNEAQLCRFDRITLQRIFTGLPALERRLLDEAAHELAAAQEQMLLLGRKTARERVASFLLGWSARQETKTGAPVTLQLPMSRLDLADYLGLTIETVSRTLSQLKRDGLIAFTNSCSMTILKPVRLHDLMAGDA